MMKTYLATLAAVLVAVLLAVSVTRYFRRAQVPQASPAQRMGWKGVLSGRLSVPEGESLEACLDHLAPLRVGMTRWEVHQLLWANGIETAKKCGYYVADSKCHSMRAMPGIRIGLTIEYKTVTGGDAPNDVRPEDVVIAIGEPYEVALVN